MRVVFVSSEISPFATTGGLGEVGSSLPRALHRLGANVLRVMPLFRQVWDGRYDLKDTGLRLKIPLGFQLRTAEVWTAEKPEPPTYFIRRDEFFDRREMYGLPERDYDDNFERFVFFQKAVVALMDALNWAPDIVHGNDWCAGLLPLFLRHGIQGMGRTGTEKSVFTIHNLAYQGIFPGADFSLTNLPFQAFSIETMEFYGKINCLKAGLMSSQLVTTVSPSYAREIRTSELGCGLDGVLMYLQERMIGILNGVEYEIWNPLTDRLIRCNYDGEHLENKLRCKEALLRHEGLDEDRAAPLIGMISRLVDQKGLDILSAAMPQLMELGVRFVLLGSGQENYQRMCLEWNRQWPGKFHATLGYDNRLAHQIEAGADILLMPSKYEPCGLSQLYALRYGTIPVVHATGGLNDTITELTPDGAAGNGIKFREYTPEALIGGVRQALGFYGRPDVWRAVQQRIMLEDYSWTKSAEAYQQAYRQLMA